MTDNKEYFSAKSDRGNVKISEDVISTIANLAVLETNGAVAISNSLTSDIAGFLRKKVASRGIKVNFILDDVILDISCILKFGVNVFEVSEKIQENVKSAVESMTALKCTEVNITVTGIEFDKE